MPERPSRFINPGHQTITWPDNNEASREHSRKGEYFGPFQPRRQAVHRTINALARAFLIPLMLGCGLRELHAAVPAAQLKRCAGVRHRRDRPADYAEPRCARRVVLAAAAARVARTSLPPRWRGGTCSISMRAAAYRWTSSPRFPRIQAHSGIQSAQRHGGTTCYAVHKQGALFCSRCSSPHRPEWGKPRLLPKADRSCRIGRARVVPAPFYDDKAVCPRCASSRRNPRQGRLEREGKKKKREKGRGTGATHPARCIGASERKDLVEPCDSPMRARRRSQFAETSSQQRLADRAGRTILASTCHGDRGLRQQPISQGRTRRRHDVCTLPEGFRKNQYRKFKSGCT